MRITDIFLTVPALVLAIAISAALGKGIINAMIGISLVWWPGFARLTRSLVLSLREEPFVEAAYGIGAGHMRIIFRHILPNAVSPIIIKMTTDFGFAVLTAAALGFIGLGAQPPTPEWGAMINDGRRYFPERMVDRYLPGLGDLADGLQLESHRRWLARCARPALAAVPPQGCSRAFRAEIPTPCLLAPIPVDTGRGWGRGRP